MQLLVLSYHALPGSGASLVEEASAQGAQVETLELKKVMALSKRAASRCSRFVQSAKELLGAVYKAYDPLDYTFVSALTRYINGAGVDAVICTDAYSVKVMSLSKQAGLVPLCYAVISDYEVAAISAPALLDGYFIAQDEIKYYMIRHGIGAEKLFNFGLPVPGGFRRAFGRWAARNYLVIPQDKRVYLFLAEGLPFEQVLNICVEMLDTENEDFLLYVLLPRDSELRERLTQKFAGEESIRLITVTKHLNLYMEGADAVLTRPLAYESYEAAVAGAPLVHIMTGKGSERRIAAFFADRDMSLKAASVRDAIAQARRLADEKALAQRMKKKQSQYAHSDAAQRILETVRALQQKHRGNRNVR